MGVGVRISVIIAAYRPGDAFERVIASLDAQTLPQDEFETIVVDDGSPDDTFERLTALAATRPNLRVERIENSGWPSRPRNLATAMARGEWVFFMDHDDSLYPDALRRMAEYAAETRADLLSPKESKTSDAWWGMSALDDGDVPDALTDGGIDRLLPMVPHKLYRRAFLAEHGIAFPEGRRQLWEDIYVNVEAWRHAEHVAVLADTPVYLWHSSATNNSKTYGPRTEEFWDRLDELFAFIDRTLDGEEHADARRSMLLHQYRNRVLLRLSRNLKHATEDEVAMGMARARAIQQRYWPEAWDALLGRQVRARSILLRADRADLLAALWEADRDTAARVVATSLEWRDGRLRVAVEGTWRTRTGARIGLIQDGDRLRRELPDELRAALPDDIADFTDTLDDFTTSVAVRDRAASVTWGLPLHERRASWTELDDGRVAPVVSGVVELDPGTVAGGRPLEDGAHDLVARILWDGAERATALRYPGKAAPALVGGRGVVAYASLKRTLAVDTSSELRNVIADGGVRAGRIEGPADSLVLPLPRVKAFDEVRAPSAARLLASGEGEHEHAEAVLTGSLVAEGGEARLELSPHGLPPAGDYDLSFRLGGGAFLGPRPARVAGGNLTILPKGGAVPPPTPVARARKVLGSLRRRLFS